MCPGCIYAIMTVFLDWFGCVRVGACDAVRGWRGARGGRSLWLKMAMYVGVAVSFTAVFYAVCWFAIGVLA